MKSIYNAGIFQEASDDVEKFMKNIKEPLLKLIQNLFQMHYTFEKDSGDKMFVC